MKMYGDYSTIFDRLLVGKQFQPQLAQGNIQGNSKIVEFADKFIEEQKMVSKDQTTISKEGLDYIREQLSEIGVKIQPGTEDGKGETSFTSPTDRVCYNYLMLFSDVVDEENGSSKLMLEIGSEYEREMAGREDQSWESRMDGMAKAYAAVRKKITEGYENGTREVWVQDDSTGEDFNGIEFEIDGQTVRLRKLTREEEISYLDKSMDKFIENEATRYAKEENAKKAAEAEKESAKESDDGLDALRILVDNLVNEARNLLDRVREEIAKIEKMMHKEIDIEGTTQTESSVYRAETVERGRQQTQYANYRKISQMASDAQTLLGNIRA